MDEQTGFFLLSTGVKLKGFWEKKLSCPGKSCTQKPIVQGVGISDFPTALAKLPACLCLEREMDVN